MPFYGPSEGRVVTEIQLCVSLSKAMYTSNSIYHIIEIASVVSFETITIYPKILNIHSSSIGVNKCLTDLFKSWIYLNGFDMTSFILSLFVSKLVMHILLVANMH